MWHEPQVEDSTHAAGSVVTFTLASGRFAIVGLESYLAQFGQWVTVITGVIFVACVLAFRRGIVGELGAWWSQRK